MPPPNDPHQPSPREITADPVYAAILEDLEASKARAKRAQTLVDTKQRRLKPDEIEAIQAEAAGNTVANIARKYGITPAAVTYHLNKIGIEPEKRAVLSDKAKAFIARSTGPIAEIAEAFGITPRYVSLLRKELREVWDTPGTDARIKPTEAYPPTLMDALRDGSAAIATLAHQYGLSVRQLYNIRDKHFPNAPKPVRKARVTVTVEDLV